MNETETLEEFYKIKISGMPGNGQREMGDFNVFAIKDLIDHRGNVTVKYARRDFYKICLINGSHLFHYADKSIKIEGSTLIFFNPATPYKWESLSTAYGGFFCIFREAFFMEKLRDNLARLPMFTSGGKPSYRLNDRQTEYITGIFCKMLDEIGSGYRYKHDLLTSYVTEMVHYALKMEPAEIQFEHGDAKTRLTSLFTELLEQQFPVTPVNRHFFLRSAKDFASHLYTHVNYLNSALKETTGKTTSRLIGERIALEARMMLKHTKLNVAEIGYALGFDDASHFNNFFKKHTKQSPARYRAA